MRKELKQSLIVIATILFICLAWWPIQKITGSWGFLGYFIYFIFCILVALFGFLLFCAEDIEPHRPNQWN